MNFQLKTAQFFIFLKEVIVKFVLGLENLSSKNVFRGSKGGSLNIFSFKNIDI